MNSEMISRFRSVVLLSGLVAALLLGSCSGRRADDMKPSGETVEVVVPSEDVAADSAVAAGDADGRAVVVDSIN